MRVLYRERRRRTEGSSANFRVFENFAIRQPTFYRGTERIVWGTDVLNTLIILCVARHVRWILLEADTEAPLRRGGQDGRFARTSWTWRTWVTMRAWTRRQYHTSLPPVWRPIYSTYVGVSSWQLGWYVYVDRWEVARVSPVALHDLFSSTVIDVSL